MTETIYKIDENKCTKCGLCVKDCIAAENGILPIINNIDKCLKCGHCYAVCPAGAVSINGNNPAEEEKILSQNPDMILNLIKSRRSIRQYKQENLDKELLNKLKNMLDWVPAGCNYHKLHFSFIDDIEVMNEFRDYTNNKIISILKNKAVKSICDKFGAYADRFINGEDIIFRGAPHLIAVSNSVSAPCPKEDAVIALSYFELYAQSLGIGTCWCGYAQLCLKAFPELCGYLKIPDGYQAEYVMLFGPKNINYSRITRPEPVSIISAEKKGVAAMSPLDKLKRYFWNTIR